MSEELGGGPALNRNWDFDVDETGDIAKVTGTSELEKDLAFRSEVVLQDFLGRPIDSTLAQKIRGTLRSAFTEDERIESVTSIEFERTGTDELTITVELVAEDNESYELVFPVGEA